MFQDNKAFLVLRWDALLVLHYRDVRLFLWKRKKCVKIWAKGCRASIDALQTVHRQSTSVELQRNVLLAVRHRRACSSENRLLHSLSELCFIIDLKLSSFYFSDVLFFGF